MSDVMMKNLLGLKEDYTLNLDDSKDDDELLVEKEVLAEDDKDPVTKDPEKDNVAKESDKDSASKDVDKDQTFKEPEKDGVSKEPEKDQAAQDPEKDSADSDSAKDKASSSEKDGAGSGWDDSNDSPKKPGEGSGDKVPEFKIDLTQVYQKLQGASTPHDAVLAIQDFFKAVENTAQAAIAGN